MLSRKSKTFETIPIALGPSQMHTLIQPMSTRVSGQIHNLIDRCILSEACIACNSVTPLLIYLICCDGLLDCGNIVDWRSSPLSIPPFCHIGQFCQTPYPLCPWSTIDVSSCTAFTRLVNVDNFSAQPPFDPAFTHSEFLDDFYVQSPFRSVQPPSFSETSVDDVNHFPAFTRSDILDDFPAQSPFHPVHSPPFSEASVVCAHRYTVVTRSHSLDDFSAPSVSHPFQPPTQPVRQ